jgi:hypothetical protein
VGIGCESKFQFKIKILYFLLKPNFGEAKFPSISTSFARSTNFNDVIFRPGANDNAGIVSESNEVLSPVIQVIRQRILAPAQVYKYGITKNVQQDIPVFEDRLIPMDQQ